MLLQYENIYDVYNILTVSSATLAPNFLEQWFHQPIPMHFETLHSNIVPYNYLQLSHIN